MYSSSMLELCPLNDRKPGDLARHLEIWLPAAADESLFPLLNSPRERLCARLMDRLVVWIFVDDAQGFVEQENLSQKAWNRAGLGETRNTGDRIPESRTSRGTIVATLMVEICTSSYRVFNWSRFCIRTSSANPQVALSLPLHSTRWHCSSSPCTRSKKPRNSSSRTDVRNRGGAYSTLRRRRHNSSNHLRRRWFFYFFVRGNHVRQRH
jgi:hypothetical protein